MRRVRIVTRRPDGTKASDAPGPSEGQWPFTRGKHVYVSIVNDDGSESPMPNVKCVDILNAGRTDAVLAVITVYGAELDVEATEDNDPLRKAESEIRFLKSRLLDRDNEIHALETHIEKLTSE